MLLVGDLVKKIDADDATSIPAYRDLRGIIVEISDSGKLVKVKWDCDTKPDFGFRPLSSLVMAD